MRATKRQTESIRAYAESQAHELERRLRALLRVRQRARQLARAAR